MNVGFTDKFKSILEHLQSCRSEFDCDRLKSTQSGSPALTILLLKFQLEEVG